MLIITQRYLLSFFLFFIAAAAYSNVYTVISANSSGIGTMNNAIEIANARPGPDTILFNIAQDGEQIIKLDKLIPTIKGQVYIDGLSQNAFRGIDSSEHLITLDGQGVQPHGFIFVAGTDLSTVSHIKFKGFIAAGILIDDTFNVSIYSSVFENNEVAIFINNSSSNSIGDGTLNHQNIITKSITDGVIIVGNSQNNSLNNNSIYDNNDLGIDLGDDIKDNRDAGDLDVGPNGFQNRPLLDSVAVKEDSVTFYVTHIGMNTTIRFDFYSNDTRDTSNASGESFIGTQTLLVTDGMKIEKTFTFNPIHRSFSVLATAGSNTSEFSNLVLKPGLVPPIAVNDSLVMTEDEVLVFNVLLNDVDDNLDSNSLMLISPMSVNGLAKIVGNRIEYIPTENFNGKDSFGYKVCDLTEREPYCDSAVVVVTILASEDSPVAISDSAGTSQASVIIIDIASNDTDPENNIQKNSISILNSVSNASISVNNKEIGEIKVDYSLIPSFKGRDTVTYSICDSTGLCDTGLVFIQVNSGGFPVTEKDFLTLLEDEVKTVDVLSNDSDPDDNLNRSSVTIVKNGDNGEATYNSTLEQVSYRPNLNYNGFDTIIYRVCDITLNCAEDTIFVFITPQDDAPKAVRVTSKTIQGNCKNIISIDVLKDVDEPDDNDSLVYSSFEIRESVSGILPSKDATGKLVFDYSNIPVFFGLDSLRYKVCDTQGLCDSAFVVVDVAFNSTPTVVDDKITINQGADTTLNVLKNDIDNRVGLDVASLKITSILKHGVAMKSLGGTIKVDYTNNTSFSGNDVLTYEICDSSCVCASGNLEVKVIDTSTVSTSKMVLKDDVFTFKEGCVSASINVLTNDSLKGIADLKTISLLPFPKSFLWSLSESGILSMNYSLDTIFKQQFNINYKLCDTLSMCDTATVLVNVIQNQPPITTPVYTELSGSTSSSFEIDVLENVTDNDGLDLTSLTIVSPSKFGSSLINAQNKIKYNIGDVEDDFGSDTIAFKICDFSCICSTDQLVIQFSKKEKIITYDGFSPNGDGVNDTWVIDNISDYEASRIQVFNRWGSVVYDATLSTNDENGIWNGENAPEGVYYYVINPVNDNLEPITGTIVLQR